ncbi:MAG: molybdopterin molybdotransferase MoeA [Bacteriovoracaceae bacterium]|nr:molybdopterin molybdotransferase MoeA [Bacteriovoracaceae bacterium]
MITTQDAQDLIFKNQITCDTKKIPLAASLNRVLAEDLLSGRDQPPFDRCAMDGIAINRASNKRSFKIEGIQPAGTPQKSLQNSNNCLEVMTGAVLPKGCDCVIKYEDLRISGDTATLINHKNDLPVMQNVHLQGSDYKKGQHILTKHTIIRSPEVAVLASNGKKEVMVKSFPKIAIVSTGDEVVDLDVTMQPHQIRNSNSYAIQSELNSFGIFDVDLFHLKDEAKSLMKYLDMILDEFSLVILTGGVSMGKYDLIPNTLTDLGVKNIFYKVSHRPGKPLWYGVKDSVTSIFALPGNPCASIISLRRFVIPVIFKSMSLKQNLVEHVKLERDYVYKKEFTFYLPVGLKYNEQKELLAVPVQTNGSGDFFSLTRSDGFLELPKNESRFFKGTAYPFYRWGSH